MEALQRDFPEKGLKRKVFVAAGEASSDDHAAGLIKHLLELDPALSVYGMGGSALRRVGVDTVIDSEEHASVMGFVELGGSIVNLYKAFHQLLREVDERGADVAILVDFPDFNLRMAKALHKRGIRVVYFISPQLWAWRSGRVEIVRKYVDKVLTIFPFEEDFYRERGVDAEFIGHPFTDRSPIAREAKELKQSFGVDPEKPLLALLPGSRRSEVERLILPMCEAYVELKKKHPDLQAIVPIAETLDASWVKAQMPVISDIILVDGRARELLHCADMGVVASGTATVEAALAGLPFVVVYKLSPISYVIGKTLIKGVKNIAMVNIIAQEEVVPELIQQEVTCERITAEVERIISDAEYARTMRSKLSRLKDQLAYLQPEVKAEPTGIDSAVKRAAERTFAVLNRG